MQKTSAIFKNAFPYQEDKMNLPVADVEAAIPFYESTFGFQVLSRKDSPHKIVLLSRDEVQIGLAENGGDPTQDGCVFEVDNVETALEEINARGLKKGMSEIGIEKHGETSWRVFYVVAPDGLCYCIGERLI
jgi:predicted enzyme related to lactoylglutathione lyase